jgi:Regulator of chromosome condensation (RCC1) repeat
MTSMDRRKTNVRAAAAGFAVTALVLMLAGAALAPSGASAEQAGSKIHRRASGFLAAGARFSCALLDNGRVRSWGLASQGQLGYANTKNIGDNETPGSAGPVSLGGAVATR